MEIYNEAVRDLLSIDATPLRLLDDPEVSILTLSTFDAYLITNYERLRYHGAAARNCC